MNGMLVKFTVNGKTYNRYTNSYGVANLALNLPAGTYTIRYSADGISGKNNYVVKNYYKITTYKWNSGADITKNKRIKSNIPNSALVKKVVKAAKSGTPVIKFKGGNGKVVFMTAGVHGNELSSQVAAMKMIDYLTKNPISGTVYIMPFVNVKAIAKKVRYTDNDYNRIASKSRTIPNKIVNLVVKYKCNAYGDFHTTKPGGAPGKDIVMASKNSKCKSADLAAYIAKYSKVSKKIYSYTGQKYPGALFECVAKKGITGVICEVALPHNTVTTKTVTTSFNMMKYFLKYNSLI